MIKLARFDSMIKLARFDTMIKLARFDTLIKLAHCVLHFKVVRFDTLINTHKTHFIFQLNRLCCEIDNDPTEDDPYHFLDPLSVIPQWLWGSKQVCFFFSLFEILLPSELRV